MNQNTPSQSESCKLTTTSADSGEMVVGETAVRTATEPTPCPVIEINLDQANWPDGYRSVDELISESEKDTARKAALEDARRWAAGTFYPGQKSIRTLRLNKGLSQAKLAALIGSTQAHIARVENGATDVQISTLVRLAKALGTDDITAVEAYLNIRREIVASNHDE
jgi:plasmid maintenance system antidote protein VapI